MKIKIEFPKFEKRKYSEQEIINFSAELEKYRIWGIDPFDREKKIKYLSIGGEFSYLQDKKIIEAFEKIKPEMKTYSELPQWRIIFENWKDFSEHQNKMEQYHNWKYNKERKIKFADMQKLEGWDNIAKSMPVSSQDEITTEDIDKTFFKI